MDTRDRGGVRRALMGNILCPESLGLGPSTPRPPLLRLQPGSEDTGTQPHLPYCKCSESLFHNYPITDYRK